ncbi:hypothetical protein QJU96_07165 [Pasteurella skyensis]|uniref:Uncharacterized protein n=1 Tax=Phocoenobacter skyensis TaxID=97481 RepID=A0AAJ6P343_9PAST|nr:hypothetical protein [Pasteurella skyensis]MDP8171065.1 hypothetical protein [Pasteurella skyensis]MDP8175350.1 hypothetical protein [Pasteurella skyensis]
MKKENSPTKKPKRKYKKFICIGFIFAFIGGILTIIYQHEIEDFIYNIEDKIYYNFPQSCQLTKSEFKKAAVEGLGRFLLALQKKHINRKYNECLFPNYCKTWLINKEITPEIFDERLMSFYKTYPNPSSTAVERIYYNFFNLLKENGEMQIYKGGPIDLTRFSIIADIGLKPEFYDTNSIKISKNKLVVEKLLVSGRFLVSPTINEVLFKAAWSWSYEYRLDSCGRIY